MTLPLNFGAKPININWDVVRGDTAELRVHFLEADEVTPVDVSAWTFRSTAYDARGDILDSLDIDPAEGSVDIIASPEITSLWGSGYDSVVGELTFDLQVVYGIETDEGPKVRTWTPIIGSIRVFGDVTAGRL
jgi:hypothetical protein